MNRKILDWEWWSDVNTYRLFTYMLLVANWKDGRFKGIDVPRGSFVSSISKLSMETNLTVDEVRTALKHLKSTGEITSKSHSKFTVFTVENYNKYQANPKQDTKQIPNKSQAVPRQIPTIEEGNKEINNNKYIYAYAREEEPLQKPEIPHKKQKTRETGFTNFQQRDYDFDKLEEQLLQS